MDGNQTRKRFSDSSVELSSYSRLYDENLTSSADICLWDHPALEQVKRTQAPRFRVFMTRLEPRIKVFADEKLTQPVAYSREVAENMIAEANTSAVAEGYLFDATSVGQVMCLGVGRFPHNLLRPYVGDDADRYYDAPEALDPACVCGQISRDHGLVFLATDGTVKYRDFGTKKQGRRAGSKNGTWINGEYRIHNAVVDWREGDYLGLGGRVWVRQDGQLIKAHVFKLRYERLDARPTPGDPAGTAHGTDHGSGPDPDGGPGSGPPG